MELNFDHIYQFWTDQSQKKVIVSSIVLTFWNYKYFTHNVRWKNIYAFVQLNHVIHPRHLYCSVMLHDTLKAFDDFKNKQKNVWSNVFWQIKVRIFWKCIQYTTQWDKKQMLKKFLLAKTTVQKMPYFFFCELQLITVLLLICDSYLSWSTRFVSLNCMWDFPFSISFRFY